MARKNMRGIACRSPKARSTASRYFIHTTMSCGSLKRTASSPFVGDFGPPPEGDLLWPPFRSFGRDFYTYQLLLDLKVGKDFAVRTEPHPRFYTDTSDTVPIAVPALLRTGWVADDCLRRI